VTVACSAKTAIDTLDTNPSLVQRLRDNVAYARAGIGGTGFEVLASPTAICPIIVGETAQAISMSNELLDMGVFAIGFGYPVVPEGTARIRVQISAAHEQEHLDRLIAALTTLSQRS
jgi:glycine C-acetyltransferase